MLTDYLAIYKVIEQNIVTSVIYGELTSKGVLIQLLRGFGWAYRLESYIQQCA